MDLIGSCRKTHDVLVLLILIFVLLLLLLLLFSGVVICAADGIAVGLDDIAVASDSGEEDLDENGGMEWEEVNRDDADVVFMQHTGEIICQFHVSIIYHSLITYCKLLYKIK